MTIKERFEALERQIAKRKRLPKPVKPSKSEEAVLEFLEQTKKRTTKIVQQ